MKKKLATLKVLKRGQKVTDLPNDELPQAAGGNDPTSPGLPGSGDVPTNSFGCGGPHSCFT